MKRRHFLIAFHLIVVGCAIVLCGSCRREGINNRPNLLFVFPDQLRRQAMGFMQEDQVITPRIDAFSEESQVFTQAISNVPICTPFRAMLLTGRYPHSTGIRTNLLRVQNYGLDTAEVTLGEALKSQGYQTAYIGKWHLANPALLPPRTDPRHILRDGGVLPGPNRHGFDFSLKSEHMHRNFANTYWKNGQEIIQTHDWAMDYETDQAIEVIRNRKKDQPFALLLSWGPPHAPFEVPEKYLEMYSTLKYRPRPNVDTANIDPDTYKYLAGITWCDDNFGRLLDALAEEGLEENTIVVFTSDHGEMLNSHGDFHEKTYWYEETIGIPFLIRWPGKIKPGKNHMLFSVYDYMPTLLGLMGLQIPDVVEGADWSRCLLDAREPGPESAFIAHYPYLGYGVPYNDTIRYHTVFEQGKRRMAQGFGDLSQIGFRGVTTGRYTYVVDKCPADEPELSFNWRHWKDFRDYDVQYAHPGILRTREFFYDNENDPYQMSPIPADSVAYFDKINRMRAHLEEWLSRTGDEFITGQQ